MTDREQQQQLLAALNAWDRALRRDECGDWRINGKHGHIHAWGDGTTWLIYLGPGQDAPYLGGSKPAWTWAKKRLSFCQVTQDGDDEGCLRLTTRPTPEQAEVIRELLGIRKRTEYTPEQLEARRTQMAKARNALSSNFSGDPVPETA